METFRKKMVCILPITVCFIMLSASCNKKSPTGAGNDDNTLTDIDGNEYQIIQIGNQWWMAENLKVTHYRNGDAIPNVTDGPEWSNLTTGAYCMYDNSASNGNIYGYLYNWYAIDADHNIAPQGWHVPTDEDWKELEMFLGMSQTEADAMVWRGTDEGGKLKETGTAHWNDPNIGATNESGFSALPGGYHWHDDGSFHAINQMAKLWSSTEYNNLSAYYRTLWYNNSEVGRSHSDKRYGHSIRLVKD